MPGVNDRNALPVVWQGDVGDYAIAVAWSRDSMKIAAAAVSGAVVVFDAATGDAVCRLPGHGFGTTDLSWNPSGTLLASSGQDGTVKIWDDSPPSEALSLGGGAAWVEHISWSPSGNFLAAAAGKSLRIWDAAEMRVVASREVATTIAAMAWKPDFDELAVASYNGLDVVDASSNRSTRVIDWKLSVLAIAWSPDGQFLCTGDQDASAHLWNLQTGEPLRMWGYQTKVRELSWDASGEYLATGGGPQVTVWNRSQIGSASADPFILRNRRAATISSVQFRPSGSILVSGDVQGDVTTWDVGKHSQRLSTQQFSAEISHVRWAPDSNRIAVGTSDGEISVLAFR